MRLPAARPLQYFFFGQDFSNGLRTAFAVVVPAAVAAQAGQFAVGLAVSTGAVCASVADLPGPATDRRTGLAAAAGLSFAVSLLTGLLAPHRGLLGLELAALAFALSLFQVWGARAGAVGTAGLLSVVLTLAHPAAGPPEALAHALQQLAGSAWYLALAVLLNWARPYRATQQALGESIHALARYLVAKADFYRSATDLAADYRRLVARQVEVHDAQQAVRELLLAGRRASAENSRTGRRLVLAFRDTVDLYEQITATYHDYAALRAAFGPSGVLDDVAALARRQAAALDRLGAAIQADRPPAGPAPDFGPDLDRLWTRLDRLQGERPDLVGVFGLRKTLVNLRDLGRRLTDIGRYFAPDAGAAPVAPVQAVASQSFDWRAYGQNFTLRSAAFRHALRMAAACVAAWLVAEFLRRGPHSYWVLVTVVAMLKPGFGLTRQRNLERVLGTLAGGALGGAALALVPGARGRFAVLVAFAVVAYSFQRRRYAVFAVFLTAYLMLLFAFLKLGYLGVLAERVTDTLVGCGLALAAGYLLFPRWEAQGLPELMAAALRANLAYLRQLHQRLAAPASGAAGAPTPAYRQARKEAYVAAGNLAAAFQRMLSEPKAKQRHPRETHEFVVLNATLAATVAALAPPDSDPALAPPPYTAATRRALLSTQAALLAALRRLAPEQAASLEAELAPPAPVAPPADDPSWREQLAFLQKIGGDLVKATAAVAA